MQTGTERDEGARPNQNRYRFPASVELSPTSAPGLTGERQENLDAVVSLAGAAEETPVSVIDILTIKWATGDLPDECRFLLDAKLMFFEERERPDLEAVR